MLVELRRPAGDDGRRVESSAGKATVRTPSISSTASSPSRSRERERLADRLHRPGRDAGRGSRSAPLVRASAAPGAPRAPARSSSRCRTRRSFVAKRIVGSSSMAAPSRANWRVVPGEDHQVAVARRGRSRTARCSGACSRARPGDRRSRASRRTGSRASPGSRAAGRSSPAGRGRSRAARAAPRAPRRSA